MYDVAIIGAGVIGASIFRELTKYDLKVTVLEKENDVSMGTSKANSAIVHAGYDPKVGTLMAKYNVKGNEMFEELGISFGTALIVLLALYFIIKWAVKNGIKEAYRDITGKVTTEDIEAEQICNEEEK